jgi:dienelactone hydrolase
MEFSRADVSVSSHGATLRGWLYRPRGAAITPGVVMAHGFTAVREMFLDRYAEVFAAAGLTTLVYDHFGFGASDGEPRQYPAAGIQLEGYRDAIAWLRDQPGVDAGRIGIWGTSYSGGHVIVLAAAELPIRCAVAQVPGIGVGGPGLSAATLAAIAAAASSGPPADTVPAVSATREGVGIMFEDDSHGWFTRAAAERAPSWRNEVRLGPPADGTVPLDYLPDARVPLLLIVAPADRLTPPDAAVRAAASVPRVSVAEIPGGHFDAYEAEFAASSGAALAWFRRFLLDPEN